MPGMSPVGGLVGSASMDLGLGAGMMSDTQKEIDAIRKKRAQQQKDQGFTGMSGSPNNAYMSLTGNQY